jgi:hypothetical protein
MTIEIIKGSENPVTDFFSSPSNTPVTDEMKCLSLIEVMELPRERRTIALRVLQAIKERDEARDQLIHLRSCVYDVIHSLKAGAFDELEKAWKEGLK